MSRFIAVNFALYCLSLRFYAALMIPAKSQAESTEETRPYPDSLGSCNLSGEDFTVLCRKDTEYKLTGDLVDDEIYWRNLEVSERFNVMTARHAIDGLCPQRDAYENAYRRGCGGRRFV